MEEKKILKRLDEINVKMGANGVSSVEFSGFMVESNQLINRLKELAKREKSQ